MRKNDVYYDEDDYGVALNLGCQVQQGQGNFLANPFQDRNLQFDSEEIKACKKLYIAIIFRAIQDLEQTNFGDPTEDKEYLYKEAMKFFFPVPTKRYYFPVTFQDCCTALGLDIDYFRYQLKRLFKNKREFRRRFMNKEY